MPDINKKGGEYPRGPPYATHAMHNNLFILLHRFAQEGNYRVRQQFFSAEVTVRNFCPTNIIFAEFALVDFPDRFMAAKINDLIFG